MMASIPCTHDEFRHAAAEFFRDTDKPGLSEEEVQNGNKCLGLMYLGMTDFFELTEREVQSCVMILELSVKRECEYPYKRYSR